MNQSVQILDGYQWSERGLKIQAMINGFMLDCLVTDIQQAQAESIYIKHQFDIEEYLQGSLEAMQLDVGDTFICSINNIL